MSYALRMEREYSDFEQRRALQQFHDVATQENIETIKDELNRGDFSPLFAELVHLVGIFNNAGGYQEEYDAYFCGAIRRRDAEFINLVANQMHSPECEDFNPVYFKKISEVADGAKPALRVIK